MWRSCRRRRFSISSQPEAGSALARHRMALGARGEDLAAEWYEAHGYEVIDRNWRSAAGELDVVARRGRTTVFCEVKARSNMAFGGPAVAVTRSKQARIRRLAAEWLSAGGRAGAGRGPVRFDVATVLDGCLQMIEGAF
jgi:putative endonuclease